ncbi:histidinol-phosphate transaminase [Methanoplanus sp. FWC-SCC4]|uniref:Histidinol-phosphate aminotransferase n=1 Tax=Methanochimaera problematica TaxID=2609417 RepID=A0AA97I382_9EURY|nr:aminotransferase class I/II-fold pyridoxal phosphate-dependent enzyme [Methanoplanus sp. FWC-SCC4]WOF15374.1 histidinol-phosphate transaminase [Methanoplanus sp. FWC-SCC4]
MRQLIRQIFKSEGYVFATKAADISKKAGYLKPARLASNENPSAPSKKALKQAEEALYSGNRYPDESGRALKDALVSYHGDYRFVTGVGMDGVIENVIRTIVECGDKVVVSTPTFSFYRLAVEAQGGVVENIKRRDDFSVDTDEFIKACKGAKLAFLCSPNNPTGTVTPVPDIEKILSSIDGILFLDNAYIDFCDTDYRLLMKNHDNLIIGMTMSKAFALAGMRVGYAFVPEWYEPYYIRAQTPFNLNCVSMAAATGALLDGEYVSDYVSEVSEWRERFINESGYPVCQSGANFVMIDVSPMTGDEAVEKLAGLGVIVRSCVSFPMLGDSYIRVSIGEPWENEMFLKAVKEIKNP